MWMGERQKETPETPRDERMKLNMLMDMALSMRDYNWAEELQERLKENKKKLG